LQFKDSNNDYYVALDIVDSTANPEDRVYYEYMKSGNDLIFTTNAQEELYKIAFGTKYVADKNRLVIKDFFKNDDISQVTEIYGYKFDDGLYQFGKANKKNTLKDTKYDDFIAGGNKADKITLSGDGEDFIVTLKGNDKITITKDAIDDKIIMFIPGDGNDTVSVERDSEANVRLENYGVLFEKGDEEAKAAVSYEKTGDNLIIKSDFKKGAYRIGEDDENITLKKDTTDTVTVTDYFRNNADFKFLYTYWSTEDGGHWDDRAGDLGEVLNANQNSKYLKINSVYDKHEKLYVYEGTEFKDEYTYAGKNASIMLDLIEGKKSDDKYNLTLTSKSNLEIDDNGGHDVLNINDEIENLRFFFDVQKGATVEDSTFGNSLYIFKNGSLTAKNVMNARDYKTSGSVKIDDYFTRIADEGDTFTVNALQGHTGEYTAEIYELADSIRAQVATWLLSDANTGNFDSALSVFKDGDKDSIATLVGYYNQAIDPSV
ncbi:hypothetical protein II906_10880, partial [bacterium]|nr:hypothetical protein [bacterium]